jgi:branched-chain amino acid transport system substrate-binding protein
MHSKQFQFSKLFYAILCGWIISSQGCKKSETPALQSIPPILVGEVQTLTGSEATFGIAIHRGIELAVQRINEKGGIRDRQLKIVTLDDQGKSEEAAAATTKLITTHHVVAILGALASSRSFAMAPIAQSLKVAMISPTATNPKLTQFGDYVFRACFIDPFQGQVIAKFASENLKKKKAAVIRDLKSDYSVGLAEFFVDTFKKQGGVVTTIQSYTSGDIDFKSQLTAIRAQAPDIIFVPGYYTEAGLIVRQARELGISIPILGGDGWSSPKLQEIAGPALEDTFYSNHYSAEDQSPVVQEFNRKFRERYHELPDGIAALGYDSAALLIDALQRTESLAPQDIRDAIANTSEFSGVTGKITMDKNRNPIKSAVILKFHGGKPTYQTTIDPSGCPLDSCHC